MKTFPILLFASLMSFFTSSINQNLTDELTENFPADTITRLDKLKENKNAVFKAPNGKYYHVASQPVGNDFEDTVAGNLTAVERAVTNPPCQTENFDGKDRKAAKIEVDKAVVEQFSTLADFMHKLPTDVAMGKTHAPKIDTSPTSQRVKEEKRNVHIKSVWLYTFKREGDEDYHVIIGSTANKNTATFLNAEVSGLSAKTSKSYKAMNEARNKFKTFFGIGTSCHAAFAPGFMDNPVEVEITGSLFFDKVHYDQHTKIGTGLAVPKTYWEIHPISKIVFK